MEKETEKGISPIVLKGEVNKLAKLLLKYLSLVEYGGTHKKNVTEIRDELGELFPKQKKEAIDELKKNLFRPN